MRARALDRRKFNTHARIPTAVPCRSAIFVSEDAKGAIYEGERSSLSHTPLGAGADAPGCRVAGTLRVKGLPGVLSVTPNRGAFGPNGALLFALPPEVVAGFNASHSFAALDFGPRFPGQVSSLTGVASAPTARVAAFTYHVRVVPTLYEPLRGRPVASRQYSSSDFVVEVDAGAAGHGHAHAAPGLWLRYDFSPTMVRRVEVRRSFLQFLTGLCAILGGVFALSGVVDTVVFRVTETAKDK